MLALAFRAIFLVGILTWYSTSVWKMIDGYFKDQFRTYLDEEYRKNPRMKSDVESARTAADKKVPDVVDVREDSAASTAQLRRVLEACQAADSCPIDGVEPRTPGSETRDGPEGKAVGTVRTPRKEATGGGSENGAEGTTDGTAYPRSEESGSGGGKSHGKSDAEETPGQESIVESAETGEIRDESKTRPSADDERRSKVDQKVPRKSSRRERLAERPQRPKKQKVKTITLTEQDFASKRDQSSDPDFWEFEEDAEDREPRDGILVADLPFKPKLEIGNLERVTADEYCPLTSEDENCDETTTWP